MARQVDLGFNPDGVFNISMDPHEAGYDAVKGQQFYQNLLARVRNIPGVQSATVAASVPMGLYDYGSSLKISGYQPGKGEDGPSGGYNTVTPGYFATMGLPLLGGRGFLAADDRSAPRVAVVNQAMAKKYWADSNPIGSSFALDDDPGHAVEVVGIAKDSRTDSITDAIDPYFYLPFAQKYVSPATLQVRITSADASPVARTISGIIHNMEPAMPAFDARTMRAALDTPNGLLLYQMGAGISGAIGLLGLLLAIVGIYGVISYSAAQRTQEIGIRMALGAGRSDILRMIFSQGTVLVGFGIALGVLVAAGFSIMLGNLLVGVHPLDPITYAGAAGFLGLIALIACYVPARRAVRVDPMIALRHE